MRYRRDLYRETLERWPNWTPEFRCYPVKAGVWVCYWVGPLGGKHRDFGIGKKGAIKSAKREIASWSKGYPAPKIRLIPHV